MNPRSDAKMPGNMLGYVALELDLKSVRLRSTKIFISSVMMLFCIGIALIFGWRLMRDVTGPIRNMVPSTASAADSWTAGSKALCSANWIC
jgi:two-component system sensor histidine kinase BarA